MNYLIYLQTVDAHTPPGKSDDGAVLQYLGNWTLGTNPDTNQLQDFATYVLSQGNLLETWFVPKLKKVNRSMSAWFANPSFTFMKVQTVLLPSDAST